MSATAKPKSHKAMKHPNGVRPHARPWSEAENQVLRDGRMQVPPIGYERLARSLGRGVGPVYEQAARLGLTPDIHVPRSARTRGDRSKLQSLSTVGFRPCMTCRRQFRSPDKSRIRICDNCKRSDACSLPANW